MLAYLHALGKLPNPVLLVCMPRYSDTDAASRNGASNRRFRRLQATILVVPAMSIELLNGLLL